MSSEFLIEKTLKEHNPTYHKLVANTAFSLLFALEKYKNHFPEYTDHTISHSLNVLDFCNRIIGEENINKLNDDELYILYMGAYLHDSGMGIAESDLKQFMSTIESENYFEEHKDEPIKQTIRKYHHELSGAYVLKYQYLFDIPSEKHAFAIAEISRGHRVTDLLDKEQYPVDYLLDNGNTVDTVYLATLIRLADEMDIASDRLFSFDLFDLDNKHVKAHKAIKKLVVTDNSLDYYVKYEDEENKEQVIYTIDKLRDTFTSCKKVLEKRSQFRIKQDVINIIEIKE